MTDLEELKEKVAGLGPDWKVMSGGPEGMVVLAANENGRLGMLISDVNILPRKIQLRLETQYSGGVREWTIDWKGTKGVYQSEFPYERPPKEKGYCYGLGFLRQGQYTLLRRGGRRSFCLYNSSAPDEYRQWTGLLIRDWLDEMFDVRDFLYWVSMFSGVRYSEKELRARLLKEVLVRIDLDSANA